MKLIDQTSHPYFYVMSHGPLPVGYDLQAPRSDDRSLTVRAEAISAGDHSSLEDQRLFALVPGLPREVESPVGWPVESDEFGLVVDARRDPASESVLARVLPLVPRGSYFGARAVESRWCVWTIGSGSLRHGCDPTVIDASWAGDDLLELGSGEPDDACYRLTLRRPPVFEVSLAAEFAQAHQHDAVRDCTPQWLHALVPSRYWQVMSATPDGEHGSDLLELGPDAIRLRYSTPDEHADATRLVLSPDTRLLVYLAWVDTYANAPEIGTWQPAVVAVDLGSDTVDYHPLVGLPRPSLPDISLTFDTGGELRVEAGDRTGTFPTPLPPSLALSAAPA
ncbi:MAG TPA: hypothetical protein VGP26_05930 [Actinophytocola sp.]|jgi:hypothetical protein|nr:hypothetical protein [Actinophytocola sp.]